MPEKRIAAVDCGTNTILMTVGEVDSSGEMRILADEHFIARLGEGLNENGVISDEAFERAAKIFEKYRSICDSFGVAGVTTCATSAMREAKNGPEVRRRLSEIIGGEFEVISGEKEAELSFAGAVETPKKSLAIDVGGGSTEIVFGQDFKATKRVSMKIGAVKLTEEFLNNPPLSLESISATRLKILSELDIADFSDEFVRVYGIGGTPTTIAAVAQNLKDFERDKVHGFVLKKDKLNEVFELFARSTVEEIIEKYKVAPKRADVIAAGTLIYKTVCEKLNVEETIVSAKGLRYGILNSAISKKV